MQLPLAIDVQAYLSSAGTGVHSGNALGSSLRSAWLIPPVSQAWGPLLGSIRVVLPAPLLRRAVQSGHGSSCTAVVVSVAYHVESATSSGRRPGAPVLTRLPSECSNIVRNLPDAVFESRPFSHRYRLSAFGRSV
jgi:hypothetical protein